MDQLLKAHQREAKFKKRPLYQLLKRKGNKMVSATDGGWKLTTILYGSIPHHSWRLLRPPASVSRTTDKMIHEPERATAPLPPSRMKREKRKIRREER